MSSTASSAASQSTPRGSETGDRSSEPRFLTLGRIARPHGIRGELRVQVPAGAPPRMDDIQYLYLGSDFQRYELQAFRYHQKTLLIKLADIDDRSAAELLRGLEVQISTTEAEPLASGEYYVWQLLGLRVVAADGEQLGELVDVIATGANDVYVVRSATEEILLPAIKDVILEVNLESEEMHVRLLPGLRSP